MPWVPDAFSGGVIWQDKPSVATALDAANLNLAEQLEAAYTVATAQSVVDYFEGGSSLFGVLPKRPETYGPGYAGSAADDWGPAITQAWADAQAAQTHVKLLAKTYGIRTTIQAPAVAAGAALAPIFGVPGRGTQLKKLADVTIMNIAGAAIGTNYMQGSYLFGLWFDGGNNPAWTAPLATFFAVVDHENHYVAFYNNYGPAFTVRGSWDFRWNHCSVLFCGATDGVNPACLLQSLAGDGGNGTNNQFFHQFRVEDCRTGYLWCVGNSTTDYVGLVKMSMCKFEQSGGAAMWGPMIKLVNTSYYMQDEMQMTTGGLPAVGQAVPFDALVTVAGGGQVELGRMQVTFSGMGASSAANVQSLIGVSGSVAGFAYDDIEVTPGDTNYPAAVFKWTAAPSVYRMRRGTVRGAQAFPLDNGAAWSGSGPHYLDSYRHDLAASWASLNPTLPTAALGYDEDNHFFKVGDGATAWTGSGPSLPTTQYRFTSAASFTIPSATSIVGVSHAGATALTLPAANAVPAGKLLAIRDESGAAATGAITISRAGTDTVDGGTSVTINTNNGTVLLYSDGTSHWRTLFSR